jgi:hypothetical protein
MKCATILLSLLTATVSAQAVLAPNPAAPANVDRPLPGGVGRYQQWYSVASLSGGFQGPVRIEQIEFFAGSAPTSQVATLDMEVLIGEGSSAGLTGTFASNFVTVPQTIVARSNQQLLAGPQGSVVMTLPFAQRYQWNRTRPIVIEIRIYGNSLNGQAFNYNLRGTTSMVGTVARVYQANNALATTGVTQQGVGMVTRFTARPGSNVAFGAGCPGNGGLVPLSSVLQIAQPGINWTHQVAQAPSQALYIWVLGDNNAQIGTIPLPVDIGPLLLGMPNTGCNVYTNAVINQIGFTVGGGPGAGFASLNFPLPATTFYVGGSFFSQWLIADPLSPNGVLCATGATHSIVAPVGG